MTKGGSWGCGWRGASRIVTVSLDREADQNTGALPGYFVLDLQYRPVLIGDFLYDRKTQSTSGRIISQDAVVGYEYALLFNIWNRVTVIFHH